MNIDIMSKSIRCMIIMLVLLLCPAVIKSQTVVFSKFKMEPSFAGKSLSIKFSCNTEKTIKYITVYFVVLNGVGDEVPDIKNISELNLKYTGPIVGKKKYKTSYHVLIMQPLPLTAKPKRIEIEYIDDSVEDENIEINDSNLNTYFPNWKFEDKW